MVFKTKKEHTYRIEEEIGFFDIDGFEMIGSINASDGEWYVDQFEPDNNNTETIFKVFACSEVLDNIKEHYGDILFDIEIKEETKVNWNQQWINSYQPIEVGDFLIVAPWHDVDSKKEKVTIEPAMAFGTGYHETTATCILALSKYVRKGDDIYDVGSGSAILSIVASKLGAHTIKGIEIDSDAIKNAKENIRLNRVDNVIIEEGNLLAGETTKADVIVANILPVILKDMVNDAYKLVKTNGYLILSGILDERVEEVKELYSMFRLIEKISRNEWNTLVFKKD